MARENHHLLPEGEDDHPPLPTGCLPRLCTPVSRPCHVCVESSRVLTRARWWLQIAVHPMSHPHAPDTQTDFFLCEPCLAIQLSYEGYIAAVLSRQNRIFTLVHHLARVPADDALEGALEAYLAPPVRNRKSQSLCNLDYCIIVLYSFSRLRVLLPTDLS